MVRDPITRQVEYIGPVINAAARITALSHGGQVLISEAAQARLSSSTALSEHHAKRKLVALGRFEMPDAPKGAHPRSRACAAKP
jgi:class 3 adenylate cyclase